MDDTRRRRLPALPRLAALVTAGMLAVGTLAGGALAAAAPAAAHVGPAATSRPVAPVTGATLAAANTALLTGPRAVLASPAPRTVAVLGDSVGNDPGEWVSMWAGDLASDRYAYVHHFDWARGAYFPTVEIKAPTGDGAARQPLTVWNFGWPGGTPRRALDHLAAGVPTRPDLVVVSFGHNLAPGGVVVQYSALLAGIRARFGAVPVVVTAAHLTPTPRPGQAEGRARLVRWARTQHLGVVDLRGAFDGLADPNQALYDPIHPNLLGYRLLAERVEADLVGHPTRMGCARDAAAGAVRLGAASFTPAGASARYRSTVAVTDACGRPVPHAWVAVGLTGGGRRVAVSTETDARGRAPLEALVPAHARLAVALGADDGSTSGRAAGALQVP